MITGLEPADGDDAVADPGVDQVVGVGQAVGQYR